MAVAEPVHPLPAVAVIAKLAVCVMPVPFINVPETGLPDPLFATPERFKTLSLDQVKFVPGTLFGLLSVMLNDVLLQIL